MTTERLTELRSKVHHGYNLLASEAREVFAHYWEPIEEQRKRCEACEGRGTIRRNGYGGMSRYTCAKCNGTGYEVAK